MVKNPSANSGDTGSIPGPGKPLGVGNANPLQVSSLENLMAGHTVHGSQSQTR